MLEFTQKVIDNCDGNLLKLDVHKRIVKSHSYLERITKLICQLRDNHEDTIFQSIALRVSWILQHLKRDFRKQHQKFFFRLGETPNT